MLTSQLSLAYAHDIIINDKLKTESQENLEAMKVVANQRGFENVEVVSARGDPAKISFCRINLELSTVVSLIAGGLCLCN